MNVISMNKARERNASRVVLVWPIELDEDKDESK